MSMQSTCCRHFAIQKTVRNRYSTHSMWRRGTSCPNVMHAIPPLPPPPSSAEVVGAQWGMDPVVEAVVDYHCCR